MLQEPKCMIVGFQYFPYFIFCLGTRSISHWLEQGLPTWGTCIPGGTFRVSNRR